MGPPRSSREWFLHTTYTNGDDWGMVSFCFTQHYPLVNIQKAIENGPVESSWMFPFIAWWIFPWQNVTVHQAGYPTIFSGCSAPHFMEPKKKFSSDGPVPATGTRRNRSTTHPTPHHLTQRAAVRCRGTAEGWTQKKTNARKSSESMDCFKGKKINRKAPYLILFNGKITLVSG